MNRGEMESLGPTGNQDGSASSSGAETCSSLKPLLRLAALRGDSEHVLRYLQLGGDAEARDQQGRTLHMLAASKGHHELCRLILEHTLDSEGLTRQKQEIVVSATDECQSAVASGASEGPPQVHLLDAGEESVSMPEVFESDFFGAWLGELEADAPTEDPALRSTVQRVHDAISQHVIVDRDEDWKGIAKLLPIDSEISLIRDLNHSSIHGLFGALIDRARMEGSFSHQDLEAISHEVEGTCNGETYRRLTTLMGQIEAVPEEDDEWLKPLHLDGNSESCPGREIDDLELFMQDLSSTTNDPYYHFEKNTQSSVLLDRMGEERIGLLLDLSLRDAYRAIADSPHASAAIGRLASDLEQGRASLGHISHLSRDDDGQVSNMHEAFDDPGGMESLNPTSPEMCLGDMLDSAQSVCLAREANPKCGNLEKLAFAAVSALELTSSTVRRVDREFEAAGWVSPALRRAVERISRLEHEMFHANIRLAVHVADTYAWSALPRMDRIQECLIGLLKAIDRFDYARGNKFSTYAMWWLKQSVSRAVGDKARVIRLPIHVVERVSRIFKAVRETGEETIEGLLPREIASISGLSMSEAEKELAVMSDAVSWDQQDSVLQRVLSAPDIAPTPEELTDAMLRRRAVVACVDALPQREAEVIRHRFGLIDGIDKTLEEVGQIFGVTRERIRQIEAKALKKMRHPKRRLGELRNREGETEDAAEE